MVDWKPERAVYLKGKTKKKKKKKSRVREPARLKTWNGSLGKN